MMRSFYFICVRLRIECYCDHLAISFLYSISDEGIFLIKKNTCGHFTRATNDHCQIANNSPKPKDIHFPVMCDEEKPQTDVLEAESSRFLMQKNGLMTENPPLIVWFTAAWIEWHEWRIHWETVCGVYDERRQS